MKRAKARAVGTRALSTLRRRLFGLRRSAEKMFIQVPLQEFNVSERLCLALSRRLERARISGDRPKPIFILSHFIERFDSEHFDIALIVRHNRPLDGVLRSEEHTSELPVTLE